MHIGRGPLKRNYGTIIVGGTTPVFEIGLLTISFRRPWRYWGGVLVVLRSDQLNEEGMPVGPPTFVKEFGPWNGFGLKQFFNRKHK